MGLFPDGAQRGLEAVRDVAADQIADLTHQGRRDLEEHGVAFGFAVTIGVSLLTRPDPAAEKFLAIVRRSRSAS